MIVQDKVVLNDKANLNEDHESFLETCAYRKTSLCCVRRSNPLQSPGSQTKQFHCRSERVDLWCTHPRLCSPCLCSTKGRLVVGSGDSSLHISTFRGGKGTMMLLLYRRLKEPYMLLRTMLISKSATQMWILANRYICQADGSSARRCPHAVLVM